MKPYDCQNTQTIDHSSSAVNIQTLAVRRSNHPNDEEPEEQVGDAEHLFSRTLRAQNQAVTKL